jgi:Uncharacterised nucleotidyltransferase
MLPAVLERDEELAMLVNVTAPALLQRMRDSIEGPMMIFKGPEIAHLYPESARLFGDLDVLVPDASAAQRALRTAGFVQIPDPEGIFVGLHHLTPLRDPTVPLLAIEIHSAPKWPYDLRPPSVAELFAAAVPSATGVPGVVAPSAEHHALLLAAHGWEHEPLRTVRDLLDVAVAKDALDPDELRRVSREWQIGEIWEINRATADAMFKGGPRPRAMRIWARHLDDVRERTVLENHLERWLSGLWGLPLVPGLVYSGQRIGRDLRPSFDETWPAKLRRTVRAVVHALSPRSQHDKLLGPAAEKGQRRNVPGQKTDA